MKFDKFISESKVDHQALNEAKFNTKNMRKVSDLLAKIASKKLGDSFRYGWDDNFKKSSGASGSGVHYFSNKGQQIRFNHVNTNKSSFTINSVDYWTPKDSLTEPSLSIYFGEDINIVKIKEALFASIARQSIVAVPLDAFVESELSESPKDERREFLIAKGLPVSYAGEKKKFLQLLDKNGFSAEWDGWGDIKTNDSEKTQFDSHIRADEEKIHKNTFWADPKYVFDDMVKATEVIAKGQWRSLIILGAPGLGKTYGTKQVLTKQFGPSIDGPSGKWVVKTGEATSMAGIYKTFLANKHKVILYDDSDDIWKDSSIVNFLKAATADDGERVLSYGKASAANVDMMSPEAAADYEIDYIDSLGEDPNSKMKPPSKFVFTGSFINISNLPAAFFSKGGPEAVASRSIMIDLHLAERDVLRRIATLLAFQGDSQQEIVEILDAITTKGSDAVLGKGRYDPKKIGKIVYLTPEEARKNKGISMRSANIAKAFRNAGIKDWARMTGLYS